MPLYFYTEIFSGSLERTRLKPEGTQPDTADSAHEKEMNMSHICSHDNLHALVSLLSSEKLKSFVFTAIIIRYFFWWRSMSQTQDKPRRVSAYSNWLFCNKLAKAIWCWCTLEHDGWASWAGISLLTPRAESCLTPQSHQFTGAATWVTWNTCDLYSKTLSSSDSRWDSPTVSARVLKTTCTFLWKRASFFSCP